MASPNQLLNCSLAASGLNLSHSSPMPPPPVALVCPVEVCPMRIMVHCPAGTSQLSLPSVPNLLVMLMILSFGMHRSLGNWAVVLLLLTRQTSPVLLSY